MKSFTAAVLVLLAMTPLATPVNAEQDKMILVSVRESGKVVDWPSAMLTEDPRGARALRIYLPAGRNVGGQTPERIRFAEVSVQAFTATGTAFVLNALMKVDTIPMVCNVNAGTCSGHADFRLSASNAESDRLRKVIVVLKGNRYELAMTKWVPPGAKP